MPFDADKFCRYRSIRCYSSTTTQVTTPCKLPLNDRKPVGYTRCVTPSSTSKSGSDTTTNRRSELPWTIHGTVSWSPLPCPLQAVGKPHTFMAEAVGVCCWGRLHLLLRLLPWKGAHHCLCALTYPQHEDCHDYLTQHETRNKMCRKHVECCICWDLLRYSSK